MVQEISLQGCLAFSFKNVHLAICAAFGLALNLHQCPNSGFLLSFFFLYNYLNLKIYWVASSYAFLVEWEREEERTEKTVSSFYFSYLAVFKLFLRRRCGITVFGAADCSSQRSTKSSRSFHIHRFLCRQPFGTSLWIKQHELGFCGLWFVFQMFLASFSHAFQGWKTKAILRSTSLWGGEQLLALQFSVSSCVVFSLIKQISSGYFSACLGTRFYMWALKKPF